MASDSITSLEGTFQKKMVKIKAHPEPLSIDASRTAGIVVDMQNGFCNKGGMLDII